MTSYWRSLVKTNWTSSGLDNGSSWIFQPTSHLTDSLYGLQNRIPGQSLRYLVRSLVNVDSTWCLVVYGLHLQVQFMSCRRDSLVLTVNMDSVRVVVVHEHHLKVRFDSVHKYWLCGSTPFFGMTLLLLRLRFVLGPR